mmetsp:Transcript_11323/g.36007  ORF Transcript_11323/g.36007 Transcript_11323/m.36007 type:complete len:424 (-) Transcript_11323:195-1466(-)
MKLAMAALCFALLAQLAPAARAARGGHHAQGNHGQAKQRKKPEPPIGLVPPRELAPVTGDFAAPAPSPVAYIAAEEQTAIQDVEVNFTIANYNYHDMGRDVDDVQAESEAANASFLETGEPFGETVALTITRVFDKLTKGGLQSASKKETIETATIIAPPMPQPGASMPLNWASRSPEVGAVGLVAAAPASAPVPAPPSMARAASIDVSENQVNVFVTLRPGPRRKQPKETFLQLREEARSTIVNVVITDKPQTGAAVLPTVHKVIKEAQASGLLKRRLKAALFQATGVSPTIRGLGPPKLARLEQWQEGNCEQHMQRLVRLMQEAYTRRMVPVALYNECTNLIPALTFSHDDVADPLDRKKCRIATVKFAKRWNYGKADWTYGAGEGHAPVDFSEFCRDVCETRYGEEAPQCSVNSQLRRGV